MSFDVTGLVRGLTILQENVDKGAKEAVLKGGEVLAIAYRSELRKNIGSGLDTKGQERPHLHEVVATKVYPWPNGNGVSSYTGTSGKKRQHTHLLEFGTKERVRVKIGGYFAWVEIEIQSGERSEIQDKGKNKGKSRRNTASNAGVHPLQKAIDSTSAAVETKVQEVLKRVLS